MIEAGAVVKLLDIAPPPADVVGRCAFHYCDIRNPSDLSGHFDDVHCIWHLASLLAKSCRESPVAAWRTNVLGTTNVINELVGVRRRPRLIFASTVGVYELPAQCYPISEDSVLGATETYGTSKIAGEELIKTAAFGAGVSAVILRFFNVYGAGPASGSRGHFIAHWQERARRGDSLIIHGNGNQTLDLTHVSDIVRACQLASLIPLRQGEYLTFNIGTGKETSVLDIAHIFQHAIPQVRIEFDPHESERPFRRVASTKRASQILGFTARVTVSEGLPSLLAAGLRCSERV